MTILNNMNNYQLNTNTLHFQINYLNLNIKIIIHTSSEMNIRYIYYSRCLIFSLFGFTFS
ncbi:uncharacterized protein DS421_10g297090 [Arachis hypogaea]|nr:uncharacterized protein DS421_10g297090 [Arachis hypogaea]